MENDKLKIRVILCQEIREKRVIISIFFEQIVRTYREVNQCWCNSIKINTSSARGDEWEHYLHK